MLIINMSLKEIFKKYNTPHHINMFIIYAGLIFVVVVISAINFFVVKKYGTKYTQSMIQFPFVFLGSLFVFFAIGKIGLIIRN